MDKDRIKLFLDRHICLRTDKKIPFKEQIEIEKELYNIVEMYYEDMLSRKAVFEAIDDCNSSGLTGIFCSYDDGERFKEYINKKLPPNQCCNSAKEENDG